MSSPSDVFQIDQNYPTSNALLVTATNPQFYTVYIFRYSDWLTGKQSPIYAIAQSGVNSDGTWQGVFDSITQTFSAVTLPETEIDGTAVGPYTVVAIQQGYGTTYNPISVVILGLQVSAPATTPYILPVALGGTGTSDPSLIAGTNITITGAWPDQTINSTGGGGGGSSFTPVTKTANYTAVAFNLVMVDTTGGPVTIQLPLSASNSGMSIIVQKISSDTNAVTVDTTGSDTINGNSTETISFVNSSMLVIADGVATWRIS
jgi:hypothetical protein